MGSLRFHESYKDLEYVTLIRKELDEFRLLFLDWIHSFDTHNHIWDEWGLFNPTGAIPPYEIDDFDEDNFNSDHFFDKDL